MFCVYRCVHQGILFEKAPLKTFSKWKVFVQDLQEKLSNVEVCPNPPKGMIQKKGIKHDTLDHFFRFRKSTRKKFLGHTLGKLVIQILQSNLVIHSSTSVERLVFNLQVVT